MGYFSYTLSKGGVYEYLHNINHEDQQTLPGEVVWFSDHELVPYGSLEPDEDLTLIYLALGYEPIINYSRTLPSGATPEWVPEEMSFDPTRLRNWLDYSLENQKYAPLLKTVYAEWFSSAFSALEKDIYSLYINLNYSPALSTPFITVEYLENMLPRINDVQFRFFSAAALYTRAKYEEYFPILDLKVDESLCQDLTLQHALSETARDLHTVYNGNGQ